MSKEVPSQSKMSPSSNQTQILLVSDRPLLLTAIRSLIAAETDLVVVGEVVGGEKALSLGQTLQPGVLLLDLEISGSPPTDIVAHFQQRCPAVKIIVVTNGDNVSVIRELVAAGVSGYFLKTEPPDLLIQAIRTVAQDGAWVSWPILERLIQRPLPWLPPVEAQTVNLTEDEVAVLRMVASGQTDCQISQALNLSERTVRRRLESICQKLDVTTRIKAAVRAVRLGLV